MDLSAAGFREELEAAVGGEVAEDDVGDGVDADLSYLSWLYEMTEGVFMTPGVDEQWTLSVQHTDEDVARYVNAFETFAREVTAG